MKFSDKMVAFKNGTLNADRALGPEEITALNIRGGAGARFLDNHLFEENVNLGSAAVSQQTKALIGAYSYMNYGGYFKGNVIIGRYASIGRRVTIGAGIHRTSGLSSSPALMGPTPEKSYSRFEWESLGTLRGTVKDTSVTIGHDVWIGDGAIIMPGKKIGIGSIVGANAVVTHDVHPYMIVAGVPARAIGQRFPDNIISDLIESEWWEIQHHNLKTLDLGNILNFLNSFHSKHTFESMPTFTLAKR